MESVKPTSGTATGMDARSHERPASRGASPLSRGEERTAESSSTMTLQEAMFLVNRELLLGGRELSFSVDEASGKTVLKVVHSATGELIRQVPSEAVLAVAARLQAGVRLDSLGLDAWV